MLSRIPPVFVWWVNMFTWPALDICFVPQTDIFSHFEISRCQAIRLDVMTFENRLDTLCKLVPEFFRMLFRSGKLKIVCERTLLVLVLVFEDINCYFSSILGLDAFFQVVSLEAGTAFHAHKKPCDQVPGLGKMFVLDRNVELPVRSLVTELVLNVPVHSSIWGIQFNEAIIA